MKNILFILTLCAIYVTAITKFSKIYRADIQYTKGQDALAQGQLKRARVHANKAVGLNPKEPRYYQEKAKVSLASTVLEGEDILALKQQAQHDLEKALLLNPTNLATLRNNAPIYYFLAIDDLSITRSETNLSEEYLPVVKKYFEDLEKYAPNDVGVHVMLAKYKKRLYLQQDYEKSLGKIRELRPDLLEWHEDLI